MARKPRVHYPGALYHVILGGNAGQTIFFNDLDRTRFYLLVQEGIERFGHRIHAVCLMNITRPLGNSSGEDPAFSNPIKPQFPIHSVGQLASEALRSPFPGTL